MMNDILFGFRCMNEKKCATPECDYGRYVTSAGRCPRRNELRPRSWESRPFHFVPSHLYLCLPTNFCIALTLISNNVLTAISWWRHPRIDESKSLASYTSNNSPSSWWWCALRHISRSISARAPGFISIQFFLYTVRFIISNFHDILFPDRVL